MSATADLAGQVRVLAERLERPAPARVAHDVHGRAEVHVGALAALLAADHRAVRAASRAVSQAAASATGAGSWVTPGTPSRDALRPVLQVAGPGCTAAGWPRCSRRSPPCRSRSRRRRPWRSCRRGSSAPSTSATRAATGARGATHGQAARRWPRRRGRPPPAATPVTAITEHARTAAAAAAVGAARAATGLARCGMCQGS